MQAYGLPRRGRPARAGRREAEDCRGPRRNEPAATWRKRMDPLFCGKNTGRKTCHRPVRWDGPFGPILKMETERPLRSHSVSGGGGWIRTIEGKASRFTVCPLWPLGYSSVFSWAEEGWSWWTDSNPRPADYKSAALPAELHQHSSFRIHNDDDYNSRRWICQQVFQKRTKK